MLKKVVETYARRKPSIFNNLFGLFYGEFSNFYEKYVSAFLMLLPALPPKMRQLLRRKKHCCVRFLHSEMLSVFMLEKNASFWTTF